MIEIYFCKIDFTVAWLAQQMGCSPDHISRRFRIHTGYRIMEMVHRLRIDHARHLLRDSDMNIAEIAWTCGYSQPSYFNRIFKIYAGMIPKDFRQKARNGHPYRSALAVH
jgi:transcriptional regulator GlxA family with amidase domain